MHAARLFHLTRLNYSSTSGNPARISTNACPTLNLVPVRVHRHLIRQLLVGLGDSLCHKNSRHRCHLPLVPALPCSCTSAICYDCVFSSVPLPFIPFVMTVCSTAPAAFHHFTGMSVFLLGDIGVLFAKPFKWWKIRCFCYSLPKTVILGNLDPGRYIFCSPRQP